MKARAGRYSGEMFERKERIERGVFKREARRTPPTKRRLAKPFYEVSELPGLLERTKDEVDRLIGTGAIQRIRMPDGVVGVPAAQLTRFLKPGRE